MNGHPDVLDLWLDGTHAGSLNPPSNRDQSIHGKVWMPGRIKDGRWQTGRYRTRGFQKTRDPRWAHSSDAAPSARSPGSTLTDVPG